MKKEIIENQALPSIDDLLGGSTGSLTINPVRSEAGDLTEEEKIQRIAARFRDIMSTLGLDLTDESLRDTPMRVAKMYVQEIFSGLNPANKPSPTLFDNAYRYNQMLVERDIKLQSTCEHHFVPILGHAHVAYIAKGKVIGLSKLNRIVDHFARRPQVQERLTVQIAEELKRVLDTEDVAVIIDAEHLCVKARGIRDEHSSTLTSSYHGKFLNESTRLELLKYIELGR